MSLLRLIRWPNLIIVVLTQCLLYQYILRAAFQQANFASLLDPFHFGLLSFTTVLIAASGYIINDIIDYPTDLINKPDKVIVHRLISLSNVWRLYYASIFIGAIIAIYLANHVENLGLFFIFPIAVFLLYQYSKSWKQQVLIGNIVVGVFSAFVAGIVFFAERETLYNMSEVAPESAYQTLNVCWFYLFFAFSSTMFREIVKDMEDVLGDQESGCRTLPIVYGVKTAKNWAGLFGILLIGSVFFWAYIRFKEQAFIEVGFLVLAIIIPAKVALLLLGKAGEKSEFKSLSRLAKFIMLSGILYLMVYVF